MNDAETQNEKHRESSFESKKSFCIVVSLFFYKNLAESIILKKVF